jgi:HlyD family secretion protein
MINKALIAFVALALLVAGAYAAYSRLAINADTTTPVPVEPVTTASDRVVAEGKVVPVQSAALSFSSGGIVDKVLIHVGDQVQAGQPLATLDATLQQAALAQAQANLAQAQASYQDLADGATPQELAVAEAQLRQSQAQLRTANGSVTPEDVVAATAQLQQSQALLARLTAGTKATDLRAAEAQLRQSQAQLQTQRDQLSAAKTNAELQMQQASDALTQAQSRYTTAKQNWQYVQDNGRDPIAPSLGIDPKTGAKIPNKLSDAQRQQYYDAFVQAEAAVRSAESAVQAAQVTYDTARQAEVSGIQAGENQVTSAQANLDKLRAGADADQIAAARAQVSSAKANLQKLQGDQHDGTLEAAQAAVDSAQAQLDALRAGVSKSKRAVAQAQVRSAQAALDLAQATLAEQTLKAPFAGIVGAASLRAGEFIGPGVPAIQLANLASWQIETDDVTERRVADIRVGAPATITFDALPGLSLTGKVARIDAFGASYHGDITYTVVVVPDRLDDRLRWNMTATVTIDTSAK